MPDKLEMALLEFYIGVALQAMEMWFNSFVYFGLHVEFYKSFQIGGGGPRHCPLDCEEALIK
jgi:hypothetical protein